MAKELYSAREAAQALGISLDTLRRWDRDGRLRTERDSGNRRVVRAAEIERLRGGEGGHMSARNRLRGTVTDVRVDGLLAQVEIEAGPHLITAAVTRDAIEELGIAPGVPATAAVKATSVLVETGRR